MVFSAPAVTVTVCILAFANYYPGPINYVLWISAVLTGIMRILNQDEYTVNIILAVPITVLVYRLVVEKFCAIPVRWLKKDIIFAREQFPKICV